MQSMKGVKIHRGTGKAGTIIYPSAEADGKRELAARHRYNHTGKSSFIGKTKQNKNNEIDT